MSAIKKEEFNKELKQYNECRTEMKKHLKALYTKYSNNIIVAALISEKTEFVVRGLVCEDVLRNRNP